MKATKWSDGYSTEEKLLPESKGRNNNQMILKSKSDGFDWDEITPVAQGRNSSQMIWQIKIR